MENSAIGSMDDGARRRGGRQDLCDQRIELRLGDVEWARDRSASRNLQGNDDAAFGRFHDPAEAAQRNVPLVGYGILGAIDREQHGLQHVVNVELRPRRNVVAIVLEPLGDGAGAIAKNNLYVKQHAFLSRIMIGSIGRFSTEAPMRLGVRSVDEIVQV